MYFSNNIYRDQVKFNCKFFSAYLLQLIQEIITLTMREQRGGQMGFGDVNVLRARVNDYTTFIDEIGPEKIAEIEAEVSDLIFQKTSVPIPDNSENAPGMLRGIWADIVLWKVIKWQTDLSDEEKERRKLLYENAMDLLQQIADGKLKLKKDDGTALVEATSPVKFTGTKRLSTTP